MACALPNDVLLMVGEQLNQRTDRWKLIFVCRRFHDLFLPLVYRTALLHNWRAARSFFNAVTTRPSLANAVRELNLSGWQSAPISNTDRMELKASVALQEWVKTSSHSQEEMAQWERGLENGLGDTWIALLLPLLNQLRQLHLVYVSQTPCLNRTMRRAISRERPFKSNPAFRHLREVSLHRRGHIEDSEPREYSDGTNGPSSDLVLSFFKLPSMRSVVANSVVDPSIVPTGNDDEDNKHVNEQDISEPPAGFSSISEIDLRASSGNHGMDALVASCADLRSFKYQHSDSHVDSHGYQPTAFYRSLTRSKGTLQTLWLDHYGDHYPFTAAGLNQTHDEWFGSLADFAALREIRIRLPNLLDIRYQNEPTTPLLNCLPSSLEALYIEGCEERHVSILASQLQTVIKNRRARMPKLTRVDIEGAFRNATPEESGDTSGLPLETPDSTIKSKVLQAMEPLHVDCLTAGVELHLHDRAFVHTPPV
ncbi:uncharacterized protein N7459_001807 [Penicillium hispanicum]|uniref:uncharacterized protein n=1 Tax=Penicillium hispanicum TaxID=1080232 RepID=UPI00254249C2|nr:uncharacterized protein N7459_001807 [Penicillium hispanicum]KAJ5595599.1 hypothetical protein N7459_001807 [Penicillium hispanicum]